MKLFREGQKKDVVMILFRWIIMFGFWWSGALDFITIIFVALMLQTMENF
jgi:hypothetical protein